MTRSAWQGAARLVLAGALSALALPPVNLLPILWLCLPLLLYAIDRAPSFWASFRAGWFWGLGHFAAGLYWIGIALLVDPARFGWMIPFALVGLGGVLGLYIAAAAALCRCLRPGWPRLLLFAAAWGALEWLRGQLLTGFPWNPLGSAWSAFAPMLQIASVVGVFGLSVVTVLTAGTPVLLLTSRRAGVLSVAGGLALLAMFALWGAARLPEGPMPTQPGLMLRLVQANIAQTLKWRPEMRAENLARHLALSQSPADQPITHVIWPETAAPSFLDQDGLARQSLAQAVPPGGLLLVGSVRGEIDGDRITALWNSLQVIDGDGALLAHYDKAHLVPFGEYVPLPAWIPLAKITVGTVPFSPGPGPRSLTLPGLPPVGPLICYEVIFPGHVVEAGHRPAWLLNLTNDGWYGRSSGPYQHLVAARMRAIEEGLPLVRAANGGISAFIDPYGRVVSQLGLEVSGVLDGRLPQPLDETVFARVGDKSLAVLVILLSAAAVGGHFMRRTKTLTN